MDAAAAAANRIVYFDFDSFVVKDDYRAVVETKAPLFCPISVSNGSWYTEVSRMLLPLSNDGESVAFILGADYSRTAKVIL